MFFRFLERGRRRETGDQNDPYSRNSARRPTRPHAWMNLAWITERAIRATVYAYLYYVVCVLHVIVPPDEGKIIRGKKCSKTAGASWSSWPPSSFLASMILSLAMGRAQVGGWVHKYLMETILSSPCMDDRVLNFWQAPLQVLQTSYIENMLCVEYTIYLEPVLIYTTHLLVYK